MTRFAYHPDPDELDEIDYQPWLSNRERRQARRQNRELQHGAEQVADLAEPLELEAGFSPTYNPSRYEHGWLLDSLRPFFEDSLITDVLSLAQGGKEASVYCCLAHPATGKELLAAKVYRPRQFRSLRNDRIYREGRQILTEGGRPVNARDQRILRAIGKKTDFGVQVEHTSWLMHEYAALRQLHSLGADVPQPLAAHDNALLMDYLGEPHRPAPLLQSVRLTSRDAEELFERIMRNVELMLAHHLIHGDLSAYNVLYWEGAGTLIDFPQIVSSQSNAHAPQLLLRDIRRICAYFRRSGLEVDAERIYSALWARHGRNAISPEEALGDSYLGPAIKEN